MDAVEDAVVGEEAFLQLVVGESFVDRVLDRSEADVVAAVFKDGLQSLGLL